MARSSWQLLLSDIDELALKYTRLKQAFLHYCKSANLNRLNTNSLYDAGMVMYQMLAMVSRVEGSLKFPTS